MIMRPVAEDLLGAEPELVRLVVACKAALQAEEAWLFASRSRPGEDDARREAGGLFPFRSR